MAIATWRVLVDGKHAENAETTQYTSPISAAGGKGTILDKMTAVNTSGAIATITVRLVKLGGSPGTSNTVVLTKSLTVGETYLFPEVVGHLLFPGDFLSTIASAATAIAIRCSGRELT